MQIWKTFGLSQPSRSAECEKMKRRAHRRIEQPLLVPHDEVIGILVVGDLCASGLSVSIGVMTFLSCEK